MFSIPINNIRYWEVQTLSNRRDRHASIIHTNPSSLWPLPQQSLRNIITSILRPVRKSQRRPTFSRAPTKNLSTKKSKQTDPKRAVGRPCRISRAFPIHPPLFRSRAFLLSYFRPCRTEIHFPHFISSAFSISTLLILLLPGYNIVRRRRWYMVTVFPTGSFRFGAFMYSLFRPIGIFSVLNILTH